MNTIEIWLTALALAMDSFTVAIAAGLILKRVQLRYFFILAFLGISRLRMAAGGGIVFGIYCAVK